MMNQFDTYVVNINFDDNDINKTLDDLVNRFSVDDNNIVYMSKNEYNKYVFDNSGQILYYNKKNHNDIKCSICHNDFKKNIPID